ncbi:MAG: hypothetical protein JOZ81_10020 [Chloroflexi bacterium]|nr:hypothetical protein [Chloroflexota bacterium]MBV9170406.1 hypothetical protein [Chloroflexota bacterium]
MTGLSRHTVVEHIATELAERRTRSLRLRPAYLKLALAILADDDVEPATAMFAETQPVSHANPAA